MFLELLHITGAILSSLMVPVPVEGTVNITMNKCVTEDQRPVLKKGIADIICNGLNCTGGYRAGYNQHGCYYVCIPDISHLPGSSEEDFHLEYGDTESWESKPVTFNLADVCSTPDPSVTPAVDHHKQHETAKGNGTKKGDNPHGMPGWSIGLIVLVIFVVLVLIGTLVCCFFKHKFPETWNKICCPWLVYTAEERPQNEQEMDPLNNASAEIINIPENEDTNTPVAPARE
ncbi:uncharacterized protein LOC121271072 isoform X2 [Carcharodon carcharias]|uniref:uncharacterized protein LOC121271072 isoform X2 n=2 Tax=Carcharodon carcharias TaxID=13397 RepID=UPI001B7DD494|nr:uncharacterized protein LOC121271072 isoform X2 [Carcharodon carcharias]